MRRSLRSQALVTAAAAATSVLLIAASATSAIAATSTPTPTPTVSASAPAASTVKLTTMTHSKPKPKHYDQFTYQTGTLTGGDPAAMLKMNLVMNKDVKDAVSTAHKESKGTCIAKAEPCAYFMLQLAAPTCISGYVCITETGAMLPPGANSGDQWVNSLVFDQKTGDNVGLETFVSEKQQAAFLKAANAGVTAELVKGGIAANDKFWKPNLRWKDIEAWNATPAGIHLYFTKYAVAPGSFGVVDFTVPWSAINA